MGLAPLIFPTPRVFTRMYEIVYSGLECSYTVALLHIFIEYIE